MSIEKVHVNNLAESSRYLQQFLVTGNHLKSRGVN